MPSLCSATLLLNFCLGLTTAPQSVRSCFLQVILHVENFVA
uniref:Uncharacterized protein n=1 Tax=Arundo donax TaxID=35708 RepID=A0A0A8Z628_ARUDO